MSVKATVCEPMKAVAHNQQLDASPSCLSGLKAAGKEKELTEVEEQIDKAAAEVWGITPKELEQIQKALKEA